MSAWPTHPDGRNKRLGEMTKDQRRAVITAACKKIQGELSDPEIQQRIEQILSEVDAMTLEQALPYVAFAVDDAMAERNIENLPARYRLVGWQCGFEPLFVAVFSYLPDCEPDYAEAIEIATDLLVEKKWFAGEPTDPDYVIDSAGIKTKG